MRGLRWYKRYFAARVYRSILSTINAIIINDVSLCEFIVRSQVYTCFIVALLNLKQKKNKAAEVGFCRSLAIDPPISSDHRLKDTALPKGGSTC